MPSDIWYVGQLREKKILVNEFKNNETAEVITITMNDEPLEVVDKFKYLGALLINDGKSEIDINLKSDSNLCVSSLNHFMEESKHITTDKNTTVQLTNIFHTTLRLRNLDNNRKTGKNNYRI